MSGSNYDEELLLEFKNAANSVTKLFRLARQAGGDSGEELRKQGYKTALQDLLMMLEANPHFDVQGWAMHMLLELNGSERKTGESSQTQEGEEGQHEHEQQQQSLELTAAEDESAMSDGNYSPGDKRRVIYNDGLDKRLRLGANDA